MDSIRQLDSEFYASAADLLAHGFFTNPAHVYMCPDSGARRAQLEWLLGRNLRIHVEADRESSFCLGSGSVVDAIGFWTRPGAPEIGLLAKARAGLLYAPFRLGVSVLRRSLEVDGEVDRHRSDALGTRSCWYLNNVVVREKLRGTGMGTQLLREQLDSVKERDQAASFSLATQREQNVTFYRRLGFEVVSERMIGRGTAPFRNWIMLHSG